MTGTIGVVGDDYRPIGNDEVLAFTASLYPDPNAGRCEHEDWDRTVCDWVRCGNAATLTRYDGIQQVRVCGEDAVYYDE